ncbi:MAG: hypothetical protein HY015_05740 [Bacteroidetes bacterium]|nr:hypothetical protein [Bacteroidota bacterium]MBI3482464.1 hypothetical protein [Bacteroidota bacterium]
MKNSFLFFCLLVGTFCFAQNYDADSVFYTPIEKPKEKKIRLADEKGSKTTAYFFNIQAGSLIGCNDCSKGKDVTFSFATTHGVAIGKKFRAGLAVGFDSYINWQTIPIYAVSSWDLIGNKNRNALYLQMAYGWAHPWFIRNGSYSYYTTDPFTDVSGGKMINPSIGYRIKYYNLKMALTLGYKFQRISYRTNVYTYCPECNFAPMQTSEIIHDFNRIQVAMTVGWK